MRVMVIGGGGREHAIVKKLRESNAVTALYALPGNGGIAQEAICVNITDYAQIVTFAQENSIDFAFIGPDEILVSGMVDQLEAVGVRCFGPNKRAAILEGSKSFAKNLMKKYGIPTAGYAVFTSLAAALSYLETAPIPTVIKADGLALGKGVVIAQTREEARAAVRAMMESRQFGDSGNTVVIEEFLTGPEVSVLSFTDGKTVVPMVSAMDHKRALDGDLGLNTGGMGAVAPNPYYTKALAQTCMQTIFLPTVRAMQAEGRPFQGCLYFGLMLTDNGPKVIEYNCRFGDPEAQVVLPLLENDLLEVMLAVREERLAALDVRFRAQTACCVIVASGGYPGTFETGFPITLPCPGDDEWLVVSGARLEEDTLKTLGGRVVSAVAVADGLPAAIEKAYGLAEHIHFHNARFRRDIGTRALAAGKEN